MAAVDEQIKELRELAWAAELADPVLAATVRRAADTLERVKTAIVFGSRTDQNPTIGGIIRTPDDADGWELYFHIADANWRANMERALNDPR